MNDLKARTKRFALDVIRRCTLFPRKDEFPIITRPSMRSAASTAAHDRPACPGKFKADFISKLPTVEEEAGESASWLELPADLQPRENPELARLADAAHQLMAIMVSPKKAARRSGEP